MASSKVLSGQGCSAGEKRLEERQDQVDNAHRFASVNVL
jgi:hypothetical protein